MEIANLMQLNAKTKTIDNKIRFLETFAQKSNKIFKLARRSTLASGTHSRRPRLRTFVGDTLTRAMIGGKFPRGLGAGPGPGGLLVVVGHWIH